MADGFSFRPARFAVDRRARGRDSRRAMKRFLLAAVVAGLAGSTLAQTAVGAFTLAPAPEPRGLLLQPGDRLAVIGDSITEQKQYSRIIETYLTVCRPDLGVDVRQYGWSGETAEGFLRRVTNDCLRFHPTVATTCYGMNDYHYRPYDAANAEWYRANYGALARSLKAAGARVVVGSAGCVGKVASWVKSASGNLEQHNEHLAALRNVALEVAQAEGARFADVFGPMYRLQGETWARLGTNFCIAGKDGVHPGGAGHLVMAYAYLRALGLDGEVGTIAIDGAAATATLGHKIVSSKSGEVVVESARYPFCAAGPRDRDDSIRAGMALVPFMAELNRFTLVVKDAADGACRVTWGGAARDYDGAALRKGVNLADDFEVNPFSKAFAAVDQAVGEKQAYETTQIKRDFHAGGAATNMAAIVERTEAERAQKVAAIRAALVPVMHTIRVERVTAAP